MIRVVSFSELATFRQCPHKWEKAYKERWVSPTEGPALQKGKLFHAVLEDQPLDEPVLTPTGWTTIGALQVGDKVVGSNGRATTVQGLTPIHKNRIVVVETRDGAKVRCGLGHQWTTVVSVSTGQRGYGPYLHHTTLPASALRPGMYLPHLRQPIEFGSNDSVLPLDPYFLGVLLGDGSLGRVICLSAHLDDEVWFSDLPIPYEDEQRVQNRVGKGIKFRIRSGGEYGSQSTTQKSLQALGLWCVRHREKFVPNDYLFSNVDARYALLQGLMDTDGSVSKDGRGISFATTSHKLAEAVEHLAWSLGGVASIKYRARTNSFSVQLNTPECPFQLPRKAERWERNRTRQLYRRRILSISDAGETKTRCISVTAEDGLYVTTGFVLTHNCHYKAIRRYQRGKIEQDRLPAYIQRKVNPLLWNEDGTQSEVQALVEWMYTGYVDQWMTSDLAEWTIIAVEHEAEVPLPSSMPQQTALLGPDGKPITRARRSQFRLKMRIDLIARHNATKNLYVWDHKSGMNLPNDKELAIDDQFGLYTWGMRELGQPVWGALYNAARTQRNKTEGQTLESRHSRTPLYRTDKELDVIAFEAYLTMKRAYAIPEGMAERAPDGDLCRWKCSYLEPCLAGRKGLDERGFLRDVGFIQDFTRH